MADLPQKPDAPAAPTLQFTMDESVANGIARRASGAYVRANHSILCDSGDPNSCDTFSGDV